MAQIIQKLQSYPNYQKVASWAKLLSLTGFAQVIVQVSGLVAGIIVIRLLPTNEYAFYTLANTMLGTMTVLADGGISSGIMASGGRVWKDKNALGAVITTGMTLRRRFALITLAILIPALSYLLLHVGASWLTIIAIVCSLVLAFWAALSDSLLEVAPKLHQDIKPLQRNQLFVGIGRLIITGLLLLLSPFAWLALLGNGIPRIYGNFKLKAISGKFAGANQPESPEVKKDILKIVRRVLPGSIYYCFAGQISVWLISIFGNNLSVAQIGALGRLATVLSLFTTVFNILIIPRFARAGADQLKKNFVLIISVLFFTGIGLFFLSELFATLFLKLLGPNYVGLETELVLCFMSGYVGVVSGALYHIGLSRGWVLNPIIIIATNLVFMLIGIRLFDISVLREVIYFQLFTGIVPALLSIGFCYYKVFHQKQRAAL